MSIKNVASLTPEDHAIYTNAVTNAPDSYRASVASIMAHDDHNEALSTINDAVYMASDNLTVVQMITNLIEARADRESDKPLAY